MPDIRIAKGRYQAHIIPTSYAGSRWIQDNMARIKGDPAVVINLEFSDELEELMTKEGLIVETK